MKKEWKYILLFMISFSALLLFNWLKPEEIDWTATYSREDKIPYGNYIIFEQLKNIFPGLPIHENKASLYELKSGSANTNIIFIQNEFKPDKNDTEALLTIASKGGNIFIAAQTISGLLADTFKLSVGNLFFTDSIFKGKEGDSLDLYFNFAKNKKYNFKKSNVGFFLESFDTLRTTVLGKNELEQVTFIKIKFGSGSFFISSTPLVFTNYNMLRAENSRYISTAFSYLPLRNVYWDEYYKRGRQDIKTPLRFILSSEALRWAYFLMMGTLILFIIFEAKRRQRIVPVIEPLRNQSLEFIKTVSRLYYNYGNHKDIALKKINYLWDFIRTKLFLSTQLINDDFEKNLVLKSGIEEEKIKELIKVIKFIDSKNTITKEELMLLNRHIEAFYSSTNKKYYTEAGIFKTSLTNKEK